MSDLEMLQNFRADVKEPGDSAVEAAEVTYRRRTARRPGRQRRRWKVPVALVAAAVAIAVAFPAILPLGRKGADPAAAAALMRFSRIAANAPVEPAPIPGEYIFSKTQSTERFVVVSGDQNYRFSLLQQMTDARWLGTDGSGRDVSVTQPPTFPTAADRATFDAWVASGGAAVDRGQSLVTGGTATENYGPGQLMYRDTSSLPTDVHTLRQLLDERKIGNGGPPGDWETFALATDLIRDSYARPQLRSALYQVMAGLSGIELLGNTTDSAGRSGIALAATHDGYRQEVVFDPQTAKILEERTVAVSNDPALKALQNPGFTMVGAAPVGQAMYVSTYLSFGQVVDSDTQNPS